MHLLSVNQRLRLTFIMLSLAALMTAIPAAFGQQFQGSITGVVRDPSGAIIGNAEVRATNTGTNVPYDTKTNKDGIYNIQLLPVGDYDVSVTAAGFQTAVQHFQLHANDRLEINIGLTVGAATQSVEVTATVPLLETTSGDSGLTVATAQVHDLPLLGRNPFVLATLAPGIIILPGQAPNNSQRPFDNGGFDGFQVNGGRSETVESTIDGLADTATDSGGATAAANIVFVPSPDMTQEFRVQTSVYDAQYGRSGGGFIAMNLRSGTNKFHGTVYDYYRSAGLNANDYADNHVPNPTRPPFHWQQPGAEVDGPVYIPHVYDGRGKTFFMFGWEEVRTSQPSPVYSTVPTDLERNGDFSQSGAKGAPLKIYDALTTVQNPDGTYSRQTFPNPSVIPANRIDPVAKAITALVPHANYVPATGNSGNFFSGPNNVTDAYDVFSYHVDHAISQNHHLSFVYLYSDRHQTQGLNGYPANITPTYLHHRTNYGAHVTWGWTLSPSLISSFGIGWNEHRFAIVNHVSSFDLSTIGFPSYMSTNAPAPNLFPRLTIAGYTTFGNAGSGTPGSLNTSDNFDLRETMIKNLARHSISFGGEIRPMRDSKQSKAGDSTFGFGKEFTQANANSSASDAVSGSGYASFLLGYADAGTAVQSPTPRYKNAYYALFVQDSWHTTDKLTLTFGLRWDTESPQVETHGEQNTGFDPTAAYTFAGQSLHGSVLFNANGPHKAYGWDRNNFGPRVGFSYHASKALVVRGGYGVLYSPTWDVATTIGFSATTAYVASNNNLVTPALPTVLSNPFPSGFLKPAGAATNLNGQGGWTYWANHQRQVPRTRQFSFGVEYQLPAHSILEVHYVGQLTDNIPNTRNQNYISVANLALGSALNAQVPNPYAGLLPGTNLNSSYTKQQSLLPYPQYSTFNAISTDGHTSYNGLQARYEKRVTHGIHFMVAYTYSKNLLTAYLNDQDTYQRSVIDHYDIPQVLTISGGYNLPFFAHSSHFIARELLSGWSANIIYNYSSGELYAIPTGVQATGVNPHIANPTRTHFFNTCTLLADGKTTQNCSNESQPAWAINKPFTLNNTIQYFGELRTSIPQNVNFSLFKTFPIYEDVNLQLRAESFNLTNTPQFGPPDTGVNSTTFGSQTSFSQTNNPRNIQIAARINF